jgi:hypothetical protein
VKEETAAGKYRAALLFRYPTKVGVQPQMFTQFVIRGPLVPGLDPGTVMTLLGICGFRRNDKLNLVCGSGQGQARA